MEAYNFLIKKINGFIKKYYQNRLVRGAILSGIIILSLYLFISISEYYAHFSIAVRTGFFYFLISLFIFVIIYFVIIPVTKLLKIGKTLSQKQASFIIAKHFPDIQDKLLNTLELYEINNNNPLIAASIEQKIKDIKIFPFKMAVNFKENLKYVKYLAALLLIFIVILSFSPSVFTDSTKRIVNHSVHYETPAPFNFNLLNDTLFTKKGEDFTVKLEITGKYIPNEIFITYGGNTFIMSKSKKSKSEFEYKFKNINNSLKFNFLAEEYYSELHKIEVLPSPVILNFKLIAEVPKYTGEKNIEYENTGDIIVPFGTKLKWSFNTKDVDSLFFTINKKKNKLKKSENNFNFNKTAFKNIPYFLSLKNKYFNIEKFVEYQVSVIPDLYPAVSVMELKDTGNFFVAYFKGQINDDYGIKKLTFNYRTVPENTETNNNSYKYKKINLPIIPSLLKQDFYHTFDFSKITSDENNTVQYYFQVWDNDGINGSKSAKTSISEFKIPSYDDMKEIENTANENVKSKIEKSISLAEELQNNLNKLREKSLNGEMTEWENTQMLQDILDKQDMLEQMLKEVSEENKAKNEMQNKFSEKDKELIEKQKEIQKLLDEMLTDEMKELMKQIADLQKKFDKKMLNKLMEDKKFSVDEMSERLDRNLELLKQYEVEQKIDNAINELKKLSEKQKKLSEKTKNKKTDKNKLSEEQKNIEDKFKSIEEDYKKAQELNEKLKHKMKLDDFEKESKEIKEEFKKSQEKIGKGKNKKASQSQQKNAQKMQKMSEKMQKMLDANTAETESENLESLRQILDNVLTFSFEQESLQNKFKNLNFRDPQYIEYSDKQLALKDDFSHIKDSLQTLAERITQISKPIQDEVSKIEKNLNNVVGLFENRKSTKGRKRQQEIMTSANNLALLLSAILNSMQNQMQGAGQGGGKQKKKGQGKKDGFQSLKSQQEALKKQMEEMLKQMKDGKGQFNQNAQNKQLAKMLAQQEIFRQMLKEMNAKHSLNPETQKLLNEINKMAEKNEKELVNKKITPKLLERQKKISTRLLEAEHSENQRKTEKKRESKEAENKTYKSAKDYFNKNKNKQSFKENLYRNNLKLRNFYQNLNDNYLNKINK